MLENVFVSVTFTQTKHRGLLHLKDPTTLTEGKILLSQDNYSILFTSERNHGSWSKYSLNFFIHVQQMQVFTYDFR